MATKVKDIKEDIHNSVEELRNVTETTSAQHGTHDKNPNKNPGDQYFIESIWNRQNQVEGRISDLEDRAVVRGFEKKEVLKTATDHKKVTQQLQD